MQYKTYYLFKRVVKLAQVLYTIWAIVWFVLIMLIIFPLILIASLFGRVTGGNLIYRLCNIWGDLWMFMCAIYHNNIYEASHNRSKQYIFVSNHISYIDAAVVVKTLRQNIRVLGKIEMAKIPLFGFIYKYAVVLVDRSDAAHRLQSVNTLTSVLKRKISVFIFPEGTFNMTHKPLKDFYNGAFRIAIETQTPIKPVLFLDAYNRMNYNSIFSMNPGRSRSVFLQETITKGMTSEDIPALKEKIYRQMENALIKYKASWIEN